MMVLAMFPHFSRSSKLITASRLWTLKWANGRIMNYGMNEKVVGSLECLPTNSAFDVFTPELRFDFVMNVLMISQMLIGS